jgi:hypothetical protein
VKGRDEITCGGVPARRPTVVCGNAECGKTLLAMDFFFRGATLFDQPGVFMAFEGTPSDAERCVPGFDLDICVEISRYGFEHDPRAPLHVPGSSVERFLVTPAASVMARRQHGRIKTDIT